MKFDHNIQRSSAAAGIEEGSSFILSQCRRGSVFYLEENESNLNSHRWLCPEEERVHLLHCPCPEEERAHLLHCPCPEEEEFLEGTFPERSSLPTVKGLLSSSINLSAAGLSGSGSFLMF